MGMDKRLSFSACVLSDYERHFFIFNPSFYYSFPMINYVIVDMRIVF